MTDPVPAARADRVIAERYQLVAPIARGGMAEVWEAVDAVLTRRVAIKLLHPHLAADGAFRERFRREAVAAARLAHPNVVATFDTGEDGEDAYIVMELVEGRTLRDVLASGPMPAGLACGIAAQVADALAHAHANGIVHRDVKPGNILVCDTDPGAREHVPRVKVADFGIARALTTDAADLTTTGTLLGSVKYLSPEQATGAPVDERSDIYSLGVVLYEMLTGRPPHAAESDVAMAYAHAHADPRPPRQLRPGITRSLEAVVMRALEKDPEARFPSAAAMADALRSVDLGADDAIPLVESTPTPPGGTPLAFHESERSWIVPASLIVLVAAGLVVLAIVLSRSDVGRDLVRRNPTSDPKPAALADPQSFDPPPGDGREHQEDVGALIDGNPNTLWTTSTYERRDWGGLKPGVGVYVRLETPADVQRVRVSSPTTGWDARIYVADRAGATLAEWGEPVAEATGIDGSADFDVEGRSAGFVLVWLTRAGDDNKVEIAEVVVET